MIGSYPMLIKAGNMKAVVALACQHKLRLLAILLVLIAITTVFSQLLRSKIVRSFPIDWHVTSVGSPGDIIRDIRRWLLVVTDWRLLVNSLRLRLR